VLACCPFLQIASDGLKGRVVEVCLADLQNVSRLAAPPQPRSSV
jgi:hypothetical protein